MSYEHMGKGYLQITRCSQATRNKESKCPGPDGSYDIKYVKVNGVSYVESSLCDGDRPPPARPHSDDMGTPSGRGAQKREDRREKIEEGRENGLRSPPAVPQDNGEATDGHADQQQAGESTVGEGLSPDALRLCELLRSRVLANDPKARVPKPDSFRPDAGWGRAARLLLERDERDAAEAESIIVWATQHEFWQANILSMPKLREKYSTLLLQRNRRTDDGQKRTGPRLHDGQGNDIANRYRDSHCTE